MVDIPHDVWALFGLRESPYFQETLGTGSPYPSDLFVGREEESQRALRVAASGPSSRQVIQGAPGVGKTTLVQHVKDELAQLGYIVRWRPVPITSEQSSTTLVVDILASVYEAVLGCVPDLADETALEATRNLVRSYRQREFSGGVSVMGSGVQLGSQASSHMPADAGVFNESWRLLVELTSRVTRDEVAPGIVIHINNLENLIGAEEQERGALVVRDLRDLFLGYGLHWLVVGTTVAVQATIGAHEQTRSIFLPSHPPLEPLSENQFVAMLERRYAFLARGERPLVRPVEDEAAAGIYRLFYGDLRGALRTLEQGCLILAGFTEGGSVRPLGYREIVDTLRPRYEAEMKAELTEAQGTRLRSLAETRAEGVTTGDLVGTWEVSRQRVRQILEDLERKGHVQRMGRSGRSVLYSLTGTGRIALGMVE